jgi:hypothetical protein
MSEISAIQSATLGIKRGMEGAAKNAREIASKDALEGNSENLATSIVELKENVNQVKASAKALKIIDETIGTILDVKA